MNVAQIAIIVSGLSLLTAFSSLFWTIYKDTRYRASVRVKLSQQRVDGHGPFPVLEIFNHGPGGVTLDYYIFDRRSWYQRITTRKSRRNLIFSKSPLNIKLSAGDSHRRIMMEVDFAVGSPHALVGVCDMFRNAYFAPWSEVRLLNKAIRSSKNWTEAQ
jgi:hypothetical protein